MPEAPAGEPEARSAGAVSAHRARCPTCGARRSAAACGGDGSHACHRCASDLSLLVAVEAEADRLYQEALAAYRRGHFRTAAALAARAAGVEARPDVDRLLAAAALRAGDFITALRVARTAMG